MSDYPTTRDVMDYYEDEYNRVRKWSDMKPFDLYIAPDHQRAIIDGASHVAVEWVENDACCKGSVIATGTEAECLAEKRGGVALVLDGCKPWFAVWESSEVLPLIHAGAPSERQATP